jgi:hypothetical protein
LGLARALYLAGDVRPSRPAAKTALEDSLAAGDGRIALRACLHLAQTHIATQEGAAAVRWVRRGLAHAGDVDAPWARTKAQLLLAEGQRTQAEASQQL